MARMVLRSGINEARTHVAIELWMDDKPLGHIVYEASDLENLIHQLAAHRSALTDEVPRDLDPIVMLDTIIDPIWKVPAPEHQPADGKILALRHPGFGWMGFQFPRNEAAAVADWLTKCGDGGSNP